MVGHNRLSSLVQHDVYGVHGMGWGKEKWGRLSEFVYTRRVVGRMYYPLASLSTTYTRFAKGVATAKLVGIV